MKRGRPKSGDERKSENGLATKKALEKLKKVSRRTKDPNKPKRPPSAFFVFMEQFRKEFKEKNPDNKLVSVVGKAGGDKWKSMADAEKAPSVAKADKLKDEYLKKMRSYNGSDGDKKAADDESSDKYTSEVSEEVAGSHELLYIMRYKSGLDLHLQILLLLLLIMELISLLFLSCSFYH